MNTVALTGRVASSPTHRFSSFMHRTDFDIVVPTARRKYTLRVSALNELAKAARRLEIGDRVEITGYLHSEPFDMPDRTVWHRVEIVAYEIDREPADRRSPAGALL